MENKPSPQKIALRIKGRRYFFVLNSPAAEERVRILERQHALDWLADLYFPCNDSENPAIGHSGTLEVSVVGRERMAPSDDNAKK